MSFMFNPYPYHDPAPVNHITLDTFRADSIRSGDAGFRALVAEKLAGRKKALICIDGYVSAPFERLAELAAAECLAAGSEVRIIPTATLCRPSAELDAMLAPYLPIDPRKDPVSLYGRVFEGTHRDLFDPDKLGALEKEIRSFPGVLILCGNGALIPELRAGADLKIFADVTPMQTVLNIKRGGFRNLGSDEDRPFKTTMRRCYYVDFELAFQLRRSLLAEGFDLYVGTDDPDKLTSMTYENMQALLSRTADYPFRCRPVYLEGVWGGYFVQNLRHLPREMKNCAWVFDLIPMEVSLVVECDGATAEFPFYTFIDSAREKLLGAQCYRDFRGYFPIRFNYDDTFHANGNMSVQLHPGEKYLVENSNELGRQDESYYIVATAQGARTYLGFHDDADIDAFLTDIKRSEKDHTEVDYQHYVNAVESKPGVQVMIPAGTIHASGRNQLILEIGSLTIGSYTYKMYDYLRRDLDGNPRPIHSYYGEANLNHDMRATYVEKNLVNGGSRVLRDGADWSEYVVGECDQLYFSLRNEKFIDKIEDDTAGDFHVLVLVDGEEVEIRSKQDPSLRYTQKFLDMIVVPASVGPYEIVNKKAGTTVVMHKTLLKR